MLFATVALAALVVANAPGGKSPPPGEDLTPLLSDHGTGTRRKSLDPGEASIMARVLVGEAAGQGDAEVREIARVIFRRAARAPDGLLGALFKNRTKPGTAAVWAFTCLDPVRAHGSNVWGAGVTRTHEFRRMLSLLNDEWQRGTKSAFTNYFHEGAMIPAGSIPRWAIGQKITRIGDASFVTLNEGG